VRSLSSGRDARGAELGGLAHDGVHERALGQRLAERDFVGQGLGLLAEAHLEHRGVFPIAGELADPLGAPAVEGDDGVARVRAIDGHKMVRLVGAENVSSTGSAVAGVQ
jgi:hypothetical protein